MDNAEKTFPTDDELRLQRAWSFLSLELSKRFFEEMWVPVVDPEEFQTNLRICMTALKAETIDYAFPGRLNAAIHSQVISKLSETEQLLLPMWTRCVYLAGGHDRLGETLWNALTARLANQPESLMGEIQGVLSLVQRRKLEIAAGLKRKLDEQARFVESEWDHNQLDSNSAGIEKIQTKIDLISSYNVFAACWERYCSQLSIRQLCLIYEAGVEIAKQRQMMESGLPFPGSWRFDLMPFSSRFGRID